MTPRLSNSSLASAPAGVRLPSYDRTAITPGIVHLGVGNFHRAHQAVYTDDCLAAGQRDWGIVAASLRSPDTRDALEPQDGLYTLVTRENEHKSLRIVGSIGKLLVAPQDPGGLLGALADPRIRIVTLTVTEKGYLADLSSRTLRGDHPDVRHDLAHPATPRSALGFVVEALVRRRQSGVAPFTVLSCDNLPSNGETLRRVMLAFAAERDRALASYVEQEVAFPSSMVDRIVPITTDEVRKDVAETLGLVDAWPVVTEPFIQWVIEDKFTAGRPGWDIVGAQFVADVSAYEHMKLRLLNGAHSALAALARLAGLATVDEAIAHPLVRAFVMGYWTEAARTVSAHLDPAAYTRSLLDRFANTSLGHRTDQIATDASQKVPQRIVAPLVELRQRGLPHWHLIYALAAWIRSCALRGDDGRSFILNDPTLTGWPGLPDQGHCSVEETIAAFLGYRAVFGDALPRDQDFRQSLTEALRALRDRGALRAISAL